MNDGRKLILASDHLVPNAAICDPELTLGPFPVVTAGAGMDALTHCIEAVLSPWMIAREAYGIRSNKD